MSNKRQSNSSQQQQQQKKPNFNDQPTVIPTKDDDKKSMNGSQVNDSHDGNQQQQQQSKFDLPQIPKFQSLPLRDYFDNKLSAILLEGLKEIGRQRPENPIRFLGEYLLEQDKQK
ncbi:unnamed protein product [Paramecium octaurelia]|uniref:Uncharacterized protein n=1 Tax=Paramecium octaurelia TaxID=43137 RepID=A0A8S1TJH4_PAROT|nr:unnamed protein product [Paramecium octaurelia]